MTAQNFEPTLAAEASGMKDVLFRSSAGDRRGASDGGVASGDDGEGIEGMLESKASRGIGGEDGGGSVVARVGRATRWAQHLR